MKAIIAGGGIAGLTTAIALAHFEIESEVYEAAPDIGEVGAGLWVAPNAMKVFQLLALDEAIRAAGRRYLNTIEIRDLKGAALSVVDCQEVLERFGETTTAIHRARLHALLLERARGAGASVHTGARLVSYEASADGVTARFEDGREARGDLLIGADGIKSATREQMIGPVTYRYSGQTCYRALIPWETDAPPGMIEIWGAQPGLRAAYGLVEPDVMYMYVTMQAEQDEEDIPTTRRGLLKEALHDFPEPVAALLEATPRDAVLRNDLYDFAPLDTWTEGRVALVGDAAHATTPNLGQGACQAIESAWVIAHALHHQASIEAAFADYQRRRMPRAHFVTKQSWRLGQAANIESSVLRSMRDFAMRHTPRWVEQRMFDRLYRFEPDA